ncbi:MAG: hypothetical protein R3A48_28650 [Polyangiales bacterium]
MSARVVSLRALVVEDIARTADWANRPAAALLLRRFPEDPEAVKAIADELRVAATPRARVAGCAAGYLADGSDPAALRELVDYTGLTDAEWIEETCREQGVAVAEVSA